jgi:hypothetical protein
MAGIAAERAAAALVAAAAAAAGQGSSLAEGEAIRLDTPQQEVESDDETESEEESDAQSVKACMARQVAAAAAAAAAAGGAARRHFFVDPPIDSYIDLPLTHTSDYESATSVPSSRPLVVGASVGAATQMEVPSWRFLAAGNLAVVAGVEVTPM